MNLAVMLQPELAHVLVVDDDPDLLRLLSMRLRASGYRVSAVDSAESALARVATERPDLVLSDVRLPAAMVWRSSTNCVLGIRHCR
jgi:two-component system response regulator GlrR